MKEKWNISVEEYDASEEKDDDALVFEVGDMLAAVSLATYLLPNGEAEPVSYTHLSGTASL